MNMTVYDSGDIMIRQGDSGNCMYYILAGKVGVFLDHGTERQKNVAELAEEQFFGEMSLLNQAPRSATVVALEDNTCVQAISRENFKEFCTEYPERVFAIMQQLSERLRTAISG